MSSTSKAKCVKSGPTWTGPLPSYLQISMSSSLSGALKKHQLRPALGGRASDLFETKHLLIKVNRLFQIGHAVTCVKKFLNHRQPFYSRVSKGVEV